MSADHDLVVVGGNAGGLSAAVFARQCGVQRVTILEPGTALGFPDVVGPHGLDVGYGERVTGIDVEGDVLVVTTGRRSYRTRAVLVAERTARTDWSPTVPTADSDRVLVDRLPDHPSDADVLVVGHTDHAVELAVTLVDKGSGVVLAAGGMDPSRLSPVAVTLLNRLERERQATLLYRSLPTAIRSVDGYPMADFDDRRTPDLQFDYVVFASGRRPHTTAEVGLTDAALATGRVWFLGEPDETADTIPTAPGWRVGRELLAAAFPEVTVPEPARPERRRGFPEVIDELRAEHYNATITHFEPTHSDLWVLRVKPDHGSVSHLPGQYASLGLGYWEERVDDAVDPDLDARFDKLIRRSYSISCRMFDEHGYLADDSRADELEFYIVLVPPTPDNVPGLTPRLALKKPGDRIYLGPKVAGRYTLAPVTDPAGTVVLLSTGTGEAPHNAMVTELLRKGHHGPIVSAVTVRQWADLGYLDLHRELERRYPNYHYVPLPTREPDVPKRYIQDLITDDVFGTEHGIALDPATTHVFLCGNPAMIGLPEEVDGAVTYPETTGVVELLAARGFTLDHRNQRGNIHFEEYW
ncbi:MAG TPA: NAD(P)-binding domain-containing protein [Acidimicrobiales bacterium]|nr:NAD(P)-binding domain-containing protein [Acidimicrobiales bacterium]HMS86899.1 NAD(P)-binding domain-containing protein [Acidimicrobiales bacterium]HRA34121.1 NAD(P)-binding domain-containing protein [Acidimicrobiales bacterium]